MSDRVPIPAADRITWDFQVAYTGFIARYGHAGPNFYKQMVTTGGVPVLENRVKRIDVRVYELAQRQHQRDLEDARAQA